MKKKFELEIKSGLDRSKHLTINGRTPYRPIPDIIYGDELEAEAHYYEHYQEDAGDR